MLKHKLARTGNSVVESLLGQLASLVRRVQDLVVEHGEVQRKTEADRVGGGQAASSDLSGSLVGLERLVGGRLALVADGELGKVAVVVTLPVKEISLLAPCDQERQWCLHLMVEHLRLAALGGGDQVLVQACQDVLADLGKLGLDLLAVLLDEPDLGLVALGLLLLLDGCDDSPRGAAGTDDVLVSDGQEVSLLDGQLLVCGSDGLHVLDHLCRTVRHNFACRCWIAYPHNARPARPAWPGRLSLRNPLCRWREV
jgi:hypothetical protein